ncbi:oxygenase MpaB family protein [Smaragdicoccus niigatensis]|uniref:oxygenase MpaB family protein n=1 Tax=Smaragdicoccus niigatensis TaxID=359359 RepID=UPI000365B837|nr:oxygenase MpaB family protein [Smaragdicoccus niigatensis]
MSINSVPSSQDRALSAAVRDRTRPLDHESIAFRIVGDYRLTLVLASGLIMQGLHPIVNAGVHQHSIYASKPWERLFGSLMPILGSVYDGEDAAETGRRIRAAHKNIKGVDDKGREYHAMDPDGYMGVWATIYDAATRVQDMFGTPLTDAERREFYKEWRYVGLGLGLLVDQMPADIEAFYAYYERKIVDRLEPGIVPTTTLAILDDAPMPPGWPLGQTAWRVARVPVLHLMRNITTATLPEPARRKVGLSWTAADAVEFAAYATIVRTVFTVLPEQLRYYPRAYRGIQQSRSERN